MNPQPSAMERSWLLASLTVVLMGVVGGIVFLQVSARADVSESLVLEAEDANFSGDFSVRLSRDASQNQYLLTPQRSGDNKVFSNVDAVLFCLRVEEEGVYRVAARVRGRDTGSNTFFIKLNDHAHWKWRFKISRELRYAQVTDVNRDPLQWSLGPGEHQIGFYKREAGARLDTVVIFPVGDSKAPEPCDGSDVLGAPSSTSPSSVLTSIPGLGSDELADSGDGITTTTTRRNRRSANNDRNGDTGSEGEQTTTTTAGETSTTGSSQATTTTQPANTTTTNATTTTTVSLPPIGGSYPGQPGSGTFYWGASLTGNGSPSRHEGPTGEVLSIRRTFFDWSQRTGYMIDIARGDVASGRLPWISIKPPSWSAMAAGRHDSEIDAMLRALDGINGPVWLTVHHEPENDSGNASDHLAMNKRVRQRMNALGTDNIALAPILMSWTFNPRSGRSVEAYWGPNVYDFVGTDHYNRDDPPENLESMDSWKLARSWAKSKGMDLAVGEWGMKGSDQAAADRIRDWFNHIAGSSSDGRGARVTGVAVYDNEGGSYGPWTLEGKALEEFQELMGHPKVAHIR